MRRYVPIVMLIAIVAACSGANNDNTGSRVAADVADLTFVGGDEGDNLASAVTGDFDADGLLDIALGAASADHPDGNRPGAGEVYVLRDISPLAGIIDLAESPASVIGPYSGAALGRVLSVGDYNSDGIDDLAMSAPLGHLPDPGAAAPGAVYIFLGGPDFMREQIDLAATSGDAMITGVDPADGLGLSLESADFDGDGGDDLLIGAHLGDGPDNSRPDSGEAYLVSGVDLSGSVLLPGDASAVVVGAAAGDHLTESVSSGDFNEDGIIDIVVVATFSDDRGEVDSGLTYILDTPLPTMVDLARHEAIVTIGGADAGDQMGHSIATGDFDGNGSIDVWLGSVSADGPDNAEDLAGEALLFDTSRSAGGLPITEAQALVFGPVAGARLGRNATSSAFSGPGAYGLAIAATDVRDRRGEVYILPGGSEPPERADEASFILSGKDQDDILGHEAFGSPSLSGADLDGDGDSELLIAAPGADGPGNNRADCGEVYVVTMP